MEKKFGKKANVKTLKIQTTEQSELKSFLIVILVVLVGVGLLFLATKAFVTKDLFGDKKENTEEKEVVGEVNYDVTIMGSLLNRPYDEYYAVIYDTTGEITTPKRLQQSAKGVYIKFDGDYFPEKELDIAINSCRSCLVDKKTLY